MATKQITSKEYFRILNILYFGLLSGQFFFAVVTLFLNLSGTMNQEGSSLRDIFIIVVPIFIIGGIYGSLTVFKTKLSAIKNKIELKEKMSDYRAACIIKWALLEFPSFFAILVYFITGDILFLGMAALVVGYFISIKPSLEKTTNELELDYADKIKIEDPDSVIAEWDIKE